MAWLRRAGWILAWSAALCACQGPAPRPAESPFKATLQSGRSLGGPEASPALDLLHQRVKQLLELRRLRAAEEVAARFPVEGLELLSRADPNALRQPPLLLLARVRDQLLPQPGGAGWEAYLSATARPSPLLPARQKAQRRQAELLRRQAWAEALEVELPAWEGPLAELQRGLDLAQQARAQRGGGETELALEAFAEAERALRVGAPDLGARLLLEQVRLLRAAGAREEALEALRGALARGRELLERQPALVDPGFWEEALALGLGQGVWPVGLTPLLLRQAGRSAASDPQASTEGLVWSALGVWREERREYQAALKACLRAEESARDARSQEQLRLRQARLMLRLEESGAAAGVLSGLCASPRSDIASPALALLGSIHLRQQELHQAQHLLSQALGEGAPVGFEGRGAAEADLGLVELMLGREEEGLRRLRHAQELFRRVGDRQQLARALRNEQRYHERCDRPAEVERLAQELAGFRN